MKALVPIANGCEEMEAVIIIDTLRRAEWDVVVVGLSAGTIEAAHGTKLVPDTTWEQINPVDFDVLLTPGGFGGTMALAGHEGILQAVRDFDAAGKWICSICASPLVLHAAGILEGKRFSCYPGVEKELPENVQPVDEIVVVDGHLITSQGPGTAFEFALKVIETCDSPDAANAVRKGLLLSAVAGSERTEETSKHDARGEKESTLLWDFTVWNWFGKLSHPTDWSCGEELLVDCALPAGLGLSASGWFSSDPVSVFVHDAPAASFLLGFVVVFCSS